MRKLSFGVVLLFLLQLGVSAPERSEGEPSSKESKSKKSFSAAASPQAFGAQIAKFLGGKTGRELMSEKKGNGTTVESDPSVKPAPASSSTQKASAAKPVVVPPPPAARASVPQIRQEIQKILDLNKKIKSVQSGSAAQFQRVQEQARIHQKILTEIEVSQKKALAQKVPTKNAFLAQEKLRIIHTETQRNAKMVPILKNAPAKALSVETLKANTSAS